ncbi:MAG: hypothetical protein D6765_13210, partial [Bacteroidetes bacterium]
MRTLLYPLSLALSMLLAWPVSGQTTQTEFGKNRVQYHRDFAEWSMYESRNFITYWYGEGRFIGQSVVQIAEYDFREIQGILEHRMNDKIEIIVYVDLTDLKQSNIGSEEAFVNTGGQTKIVGNKMFVYFNGDHNDLRRQIREGIAGVYLNAMLFGSNLQEIVQNAVMMNLPEWFKEGLIAFVGTEWSSELDNQLRDLLLRYPEDDFEDLAEKDPKLLGHSLWYFISQNYGNSTVSNLLYLTRINRSVESGFLYVLGSTYRRTLDSWERFFRDRYAEEAGQTTPPEGEVPVKNKRNLPITQLKISPDGQRIAYVLNEIGRYRVFIQDLQTGERTLVHKGGFRNAIQATDYNYPLIAWNPSGLELGVIYERRDVVKFLRYDIHSKERVVEDMSTQYQRIYSMDYITPTELVLSAAVRGHSDIFIYFTLTRQSQRLTDDFWDDLDAVFTRVHGQRGILFASNRTDSLLTRARLDSILPITTYDIYYLNLDKRDEGELVRITHTPHANERHPVSLDDTWFAFLSDESGIVNRKTGYLEDYIHHFEHVITFQDGEEMRLHADSIIEQVLDSAALAQIDTVTLDTVIKQRGVTHFNSNYSRNVLSQSKARRAGRLAELVFLDGAHRIFVHTIEPEAEVQPFLTQHQRQWMEWLSSRGEEVPPYEPGMEPLRVMPPVTQTPPRDTQPPTP